MPATAEELVTQAFADPELAAVLGAGDWYLVGSRIRAFADELSDWDTMLLTPQEPTPEQRAAVRAELGIAPDEVAIVTVANFRSTKGYPDLLDAARLLVDRGLPVRFVIIGQGPMEAEIRSRRSELGLEDRV
ncbi:MAG TPA: glycosyltransferase, partial [Micromonosporaceae bacterium]